MSFVPSTRSGAPVSSALMCDQVGADHAMVWAGQRSQHGCEGKDIRSGAVVGKEHVDVGTEQVAEPCLAFPGGVVGAVGDGVAVVGAFQRVEDRRMGAGGVVTGERALGGRGQFHAASLPDAAGRRRPTTPFS